MVFFVHQLPRNNDAALSLEKIPSTEKTSRFRVKTVRGTRYGLFRYTVGRSFNRFDEETRSTTNSPAKRNMKKINAKGNAFP